ncbi:unnamed protein product [Penicillium olsonii]|uniref:LEA domain protein n=1 Tax=Penicillium olsonii TaxID=99116 RepID=A0A9W4ICM3_PENOL|nr:unnamed protein product [Penicillium olsonii]CAG8239588.1 unnamed protein product [Penicillium olsonii]CAG8281985.1 unnamed protein product [Penicillium olsonii]
MSTARFAPLLRTRVAVPTTRYQAIRSISATASYNKGAVDATKDTLKKADRTLSDAAVKGINKGEQAAHHLKDAVGAGAQQAKEKSGDVKGEAAELAGKGKGKAGEAMGEAKGKAEEAMGEAKGKAKEAAGDVEAKAKEAKGRL